MIRFQEEKLSSIIEEMSVIIQTTWNEVDQRGAHFKLNPNWDAYEYLSQHNNMKIFTARDNDVLIGYLVVFIHEDLHIKGSLAAVTDVVYIHKDHRGHGTIDRLIELAEGILMSVGVKWFSITLKDFQKHDSLMNNCGFTHFENVYQKYLI